MDATTPSNQLFLYVPPILREILTKLCLEKISFTQTLSFPLTTTELSNQFSELVCSASTHATRMSHLTKVFGKQGLAPKRLTDLILNFERYES